MGIAVFLLVNGTGNERRFLSFEMSAKLIVRSGWTQIRFGSAALIIRKLHTLFDLMLYKRGNQ